MSELRRLLSEATPEGTRLILATPEFLDLLGTRTGDGSARITAEWGDAEPEGWYVPTFTATTDGPPIAAVLDVADAAREWAADDDRECPCSLCRTLAALDRLTS